MMKYTTCGETERGLVRRQIGGVPGGGRNGPVEFFMSVYYIMYYRRLPMITLRLSRDLEKAVAATAAATGVTKSDFVRSSVVEYLGRLRGGNSWALGKDLFGRHASGRRDLSPKAPSIFRKKVGKARK
jgi:hypothetical protein